MNVASFQPLDTLLLLGSSGPTTLGGWYSAFLVTFLVFVIQCFQHRPLAVSRDEMELRFYEIRMTARDALSLGILAFRERILQERSPG